MRHEPIVDHSAVQVNPLSLPPESSAVEATLSFNNAKASLSDFLFSGVLVRFPGLKLASSEGQIGRLPGRKRPLAGASRRAASVFGRQREREQVAVDVAVDARVPPTVRRVAVALEGEQPA